MIKSALGKVMWVGRATVFVVGLAVILAMVLGLASAAFSATGGNFILGQSNSANAPTTLVGQIVDTTKSALVLNNPNGGSALQLKVNSGIAPMKVNATAGKATNLNADKLDGMDPGQLPGSIASVTTINDFPGIPFDLGTSATGWKFVGAPETGITTTSSQRLVGAAEVPLGDPTATVISYDLCYQPSGGGTITPFSVQPSSATITVTPMVYTATSSVAPGAGTWDVGFCIVNGVNDTRDAESVSRVNGWVQVVNQ